MRAYIEDGLLHVVTREYTPMVGGKDLPEEEHIFDETWTAVMRLAFYQELNDVSKPSKILERK